MRCCCGDRTPQVSGLRSTRWTAPSALTPKGSEVQVLYRRPLAPPWRSSCDYVQLSGTPGSLGVIVGGSRSQGDLSSLVTPVLPLTHVPTRRGASGLSRA